MKSRLTVGAAIAAAVALAVAPLALTAQLPAQRAPAPAARRAAAAAQNAQDARALAGYTLSMADLRRFGATMQEIGRAIKANPQLEDRFTGTMDESIAQIAARLGGVPQFRPAFARSGMTPQQFAVTQFTLMGAGMAVGMPKGAKSPEQLVKEMGIDPANVAFMRQHGAEVQALFRQMRGAADDGDQDDDADPAR